MNAPKTANALDLFAALLRLEQAVLSAESLAETRFIIANETRSLSPFVQAVLLCGREDESLRVDAHSNLSEVDRTAPFVAWCERLAQHLSITRPGRAVTAITPEDLTPHLRREWADFAASHLLWLPLFTRVRAAVQPQLLNKDDKVTISTFGDEKPGKTGHLSMYKNHSRLRVSFPSSSQTVRIQVSGTRPLNGPICLTFDEKAWRGITTKKNSAIKALAAAAPPPVLPPP